MGTTNYGLFLQEAMGIPRGLVKEETEGGKDTTRYHQTIGYFQ
jgi:hypothetical protein